MLYYGALTGYFGWWVQRPPTDPDQSPAANPTPARRRTKKRLWERIVDPRLLYGQMVKRYVRRKLHEVTRRMQIVDQEQYFLCVAKPESHATLYAVIDEIDKLGRLHYYTYKHWNGRHFELWTFRFASDLPLRADTESMSVNWFEVTVTPAKTGKQLYFNTWITNHLVSADSLFALAKAGRARWKIENENNNVLKNHGYHLEHNFGHGKLHLSNVLFTLNLLAFFTHTVLELTAKPYQILRAAIKARQRFFNDLRAPTRHTLFDSWQHL